MSARLSQIHGCATLLWVAMTKIYREGSKVDDLTFISGSILAMSFRYKMRMQDLAKMNGVSKSTVTDYIDNLEKKGYVQRVKDEEDQRGVYIRVTDKGKERVMNNEKNIYRYLDTCTANLTEEEMNAFIALFAKFVGLGETSFPVLFESIMNMKLEQ